MSQDRSIRTLRVLLTKYEQDEQRAGEALAVAVRDEQRARAHRAQAEARRHEASQRLLEHRARAATRIGEAVDADWLCAAHSYRQRLDGELSIEEQRVADANAAEARAARQREQATAALAEAKGRVEVVSKRIEAALKAQRDKAEAQAEEEAADRRRPR